MPNHWLTDVDLIIEEKTLFRQVGWLQDGEFHSIGWKGAHYPPGRPTPPISPVYVQIATWKKGEGWNY